jgi:hypothetical protein
MGRVNVCLGGQFAGERPNKLCRKYFGEEEILDALLGPLFPSAYRPARQLHKTDFALSDFVCFVSKSCEPLRRARRR